MAKYLDENGLDYLIKQLDSRYVKVETGTIFLNSDITKTINTSNAKNFLIKIIYIPDDAANYGLDGTITSGSYSTSFSITDDLIDEVYIEKIGNYVYGFDKYGSSLFVRNYETVDTVQLEWFSDDVSSSDNIIIVYRFEV